jgi:hypothetical protein
MLEAVAAAQILVEAQMPAVAVLVAQAVVAMVVLGLLLPQLLVLLIQAVVAVEMAVRELALLVVQA